MSTVKFNDVFNSFANQTLKGVSHFNRDILALSGDSGYSTESVRNNFSISKQASELSADQRPPKDLLRTLVGKVARYPETIGPHPDFKHLLESGGKENHYIVSVFVDIKGSTQLALKLDNLEEVKIFKDGLITTVIDIFHVFDAHIHRLQGDAVFAFFGRKGMKKSQAIIDAINAATFLQQFCEKNLNPIFRSKGYPDLKIRVGIDFGNDDKVLWGKYGVGACSELTTTSLHTDLAAKLQNKAPANGIMLGDNIKKFIDLPDEFYSIKKREKDGMEKEDRYVLNISEMRYSMWQFNWERYMSRFLFNPERISTASYKAGTAFQLQCFFKKHTSDNWIEYLPNSKPISKDYQLKFKISNLRVPHYDKIEWWVNNRGAEAKHAGKLEFLSSSKINFSCPQETAYIGHHYMNCKILYQNRLVANEFFGIYVNDN